MPSFSEWKEWESCPRHTENSVSSLTHKADHRRLNYHFEMRMKSNEALNMKIKHQHETTKHAHRSTTQFPPTQRQYNAQAIIIQNYVGKFSRILSSCNQQALGVPDDTSPDSSEHKNSHKRTSSSPSTPLTNSQVILCDFMWKIPGPQGVFSHNDRVASA